MKNTALLKIYVHANYAPEFIVRIFFLHPTAKRPMRPTTMAIIAAMINAAFI